MAECVVLVEQGQLNGKICSDYTGNSFYSFQGIPYAKPPLEELRFKAPLAPEPWKGLRNATEEKPGCYAHHIYAPHVVGSEDCLYLNVYTSELPEQEVNLKPVIVCVHGGAFLRGSGSTEFLGPEFMVNQDVVLVTFNYRVGILGFLNLKSPDLHVPGNAGLKDQVMALTWVQKNIQQFGGDPNNVTLLGTSAGAASAHYLLLSSQAAGLFHRVICQSGSALCHFAQISNYSDKLMDLLNINTRSEEVVLQNLLTLPVEKLLEIQDAICLYTANKAFAPIVETPSTSAIITEQPIDLIKTGRYNKVPILLGTNSNEGLIFLPLLKSKESTDIDYESFVPHVLNHPKGSKLSQHVAKKIQIFYETLYKDDRYKLMLRGDTMFNIGVYNAARLHAKTSNQPIYFYQFCLESKLNMFKQMMKIDVAGAGHVDDLGYLFKTKYTPENLKGTIEESYMKKVTKLWINYATYGNPNGAEVSVWKSIENDHFYYLNIAEEMECRKNPNEARMLFWDNLIDSV